LKKLVVFFIALLLPFSFLRSVSAETLTPIMGEGALSAKQMYIYLISNNNPNGVNPVTEEYAAEFVLTLIEEAEDEGVRSDVAYALIMKETGFLNYGGDVQPVQNNFGGLGATGGGVSGAYFDDVRQGIRAVVQHLKCYATDEALRNACVDPRFSESLRGTAPYVEWLGYADNPNGVGWAVPGTGYGASVLKMIDSISLIDDTDITMPTVKEDRSGEFINYAILAVIVLILARVIKPLLFDKKG
jgi:N-acetylmuramoyl-L-alanine amidase